VCFQVMLELTEAGGDSKATALAVFKVKGPG
jgi:hypothetical protein